MKKHPTVLIRSDELRELANSASNDVEYGDDSSPYVRKIRRLVDKALKEVYRDRTHKGEEFMKKKPRVECPFCGRALREAERDTWVCAYCVRDFTTRELLMKSLRNNKSLLKKEKKS